MKHQYGEIRPGTKKAEIVRRMVEGHVLTSECLLDDLIRTAAQLGVERESMRDMFGYDIRSFSTPPNGKRGRPPHKYKIVGRWSWDGQYTDFIADPQARDEEVRKLLDTGSVAA